MKQYIGQAKTSIQEFGERSHFLQEIAGFVLERKN
jgi:hypothetical protein